MILSKIFKRTTLYKCYDFFSSWYQYNKLKKSVGRTFYSDEFKLIISKYLKTYLKEDWIGRLYGVINPAVNIDGNLDFSSMIIEIDGNNTNNSEWVKNWLYKQLNMVAQLFKIERLYDYINLDIKHVGPENLDNYLIVFDLIPRKQFANASKTFAKSLLLWGVIIAALFIFVF